MPRKKVPKPPVENLPGEVWAPLPEFPRYQVSSKGRVLGRLGIIKEMH